MDFAVIGAQTCATTAVRDWVAAHPQVWMPPGEDDFLERPENGAWTYERHLERLRSRAGTRLLGVKRANYLNRKVWDYGYGP